MATIPELQHRPKCEDWGSKVQHLCEHLWEQLETSPFHPSELRTIATFLEDREVFGLARMVIPELRAGEETTSQSAAKLDVLRMTKAFRDSIDIQESGTQASFDSPLYKAEKQAFYDADMYRIKLYLRRSQKFTPEEEKSIQEWLEKCPVQRGGEL